MDEGEHHIRVENEQNNFAAETRDENRSPTSGSSSETFADEFVNKNDRNRKHRRNPKPKRKRKWKPYNELSWDEQRVQDDRESRRAFAKRERLSAEGHPIAPYNTTQFLMDDRKKPSPNPWIRSSQAQPMPKSTEDFLVETEGQSELSKSIRKDNDGHILPHVVTVGRRLVEQKLSRYFTDSPIAHDFHVGVSERPFSDSQGVDDIQRYIMDDFSHTYAGIHAEELQSMSKTDLISECLKQERKVDLLEKRIKECKRKRKDEARTPVDKHLLDKINQLQVLNTQLQKQIASRSKSADIATEEELHKSMSDHGAQAAGDTSNN